MINRLFRGLLRRPPVDGARARFLAFLDFAYMPYALGDAITWIENAQVAAVNANVNEIDIVVLASRERPAPSWQPFVTSFNFTESVNGLMPALLSSPMVRNFHLLEHRQTFYEMVSDYHDRGSAMWPGYDAIINERIDFMSHLHIVEHFSRRGSIPLLAAPRGYKNAANAFVEKYCAGQFRVVVNVRQSHLRKTASHPERDSRFETWAEFIRRNSRKYENVVFIIAGQYIDVDRRFAGLPRTLVPRSLGYGLGVELALLQSADLFMGTSSGFSQAALFGHPSYIVTNTEPRAAPICGVPVGARHHPFGRPDQIVTWVLETADELEDEFDKLIALKADQGRRVPSKAGVGQNK